MSICKGCRYSCACCEEPMCMDVEGKSDTCTTEKPSFEPRPDIKMLHDELPDYVSGWCNRCEDKKEDVEQDYYSTYDIPCAQQLGLCELKIQAIVDGEVCDE